MTTSRSGFVCVVALAGIAIAALPAGAAPISNACRNSVTANNNQITVDTTATVSAPVPPGGTITLSNLQQAANVPGAIFIAGYNLGLLQEGENSIPATVFTKLEGTNTTRASRPRASRPW